MNLNLKLLTPTVTTVGQLNRLQPRVTKKFASGRVENPSRPELHPWPYEVGVIVRDANGVAWQRDIDNLIEECLELDRGETWWWKIGDSADHYTSKDIPLPAQVWLL